MIRYLLDTNIISNAVKPNPVPSLAAWMSEREDGSLFIGSMTVAEIQRGILLLPESHKRAALEAWFYGPGGLMALFSGHILSFDERAGLIWAKLMADGRRAGQPRNPVDMIVAATAEAHDCIVVTDNKRDFAGLSIINPLRRGSGK